MLRYLRRLADKRPGARPLDDPAGLVHDEAQRDVRDDSGDLARVRRAASVRARGPGRRLSRRMVRELEQMLCAVHRLRCGVAAAERGLAGRVRGPAHDPRVSREPRRGASQRVPHPGVGARHQSRVGADGGHAGGRRRRATTTATSTSPTSKRRPRSTRAISPRSWSPIRRRTACSRRASRASARSSTRTAARCTSTART